MRVMGRSDVNRIDARVCIELIVGFVHALNAIALGKCPRLLDRAVGNARKRTPGERHDLRHLVCNYTAADNRPAQLGRREDILGEWLRANTRERGVGCSGGVERDGNLIGHVLLLLRGDERDDRRTGAATAKNGPIVSAETRMKPVFAAKRALVTHPPRGLPAPCFQICAKSVFFPAFLPCELSTALVEAYAMARLPGM